MSGTATRRRVELTDGRLIIRTIVIETGNDDAATAAIEAAVIEPTATPDQPHRAPSHNHGRAGWPLKLGFRQSRAS